MIGGDSGFMTEAFGSTMIYTIPGAVFLLLAASEAMLPRTAGGASYRPWDKALNLIGLVFQGLIVPLSGYVLAVFVLQAHFPDWAGVLRIGFWGAFLLNIAGIDFIYYWQHRAFHRVTGLWRFHLCHHATPRVDVWATARNTPAANFLFVYFLLNPWIAFVCDRPNGFFAGAMITAALDVFRHTDIDFQRLRFGHWLRFLEGILVLPRDHHRHHDGDRPDVNFGANFIIWDRLFGTAAEKAEYPLIYGIADPPAALRQLLYPFVGFGSSR